MSDEGDVADDAASDGGETEDSGGRTAVVTKPVTRPQRPTGKRSRQRERIPRKTSTTRSRRTEVEVCQGGQGQEGRQGVRAKTAAKSEKAKKPKKAGTSSANPIVFVYTYLKQVVAEMRKVIWPNRKQMLTYTSVVLAFLAFMVALVGLADFGLTKLVMLVFG